MLIPPPREDEDDDIPRVLEPPRPELVLPPSDPPVDVPEEKAKFAVALGLIVTHNTSIGIGQLAQLTRISGIRR